MATNHEAIRIKLIDSAIRTVYQYGLERTTTKMIAGFANINEAYIYRYFLDRNDLLKKAFYTSDYNFINCVIENVNNYLLVNNGLTLKQRVYNFFNAMSEFYNNDLKYSLFYARFYYSTFMNAEVCEEHNNLTATASEVLAKVFPKITRQIEHVIFSISLDYILRVGEGMSKDSPEYRQECYDFLWTIIEKYII